MRFSPGLGVVAASLLLAPAPSRACATAPPRGAYVSILAEEAVIVWNAATKIQHFIRRADFESDAAGFGFIVPTPSEPELAEEGEALLEALVRITRPRVVYERVTSGVTFTCLPFLMLSRADKSAVAGAPVTVLKHQVVAGYDAVVLEASDAAALSRWLGEHGYAQSDTLTQWAAPYVAKRWKFTAFKLAAEGGGGLATSAVRLSFATDRPFYPYSEPSDQRKATGPDGGDRALRVFFLADTRYYGSIGITGVWPGETHFANRVTAEEFGPEFPTSLVGADAAYLTTFIDKSNPRPGTDDLWFSPSSAGDVTPEPDVVISEDPVPVPLELLLPVLGVGYYVYRRRRRRQSAASSRTSTL